MKDEKRRIVRTAGAFILLGMVVGIFSIVPAVESEQYLKETANHAQQVTIGAIFQFLLVPIYVGFSLMLYPLLKQYNQRLSMGFVGFRFVAGAFQLIGVVLLPVFVLLSENYSMSSPTEMATYEQLGEVLKLLRDLTNHVGVMLATGLGNVFLYVILYKEKLIPRWLSIWGFIGNAAIMLGAFLVSSQVIDVVSPEYGAVSMPLVLQELVFAIWLLVKGVKPTIGRHYQTKKL